MIVLRGSIKNLPFWQGNMYSYWAKKGLMYGGIFGVVSIVLKEFGFVRNKIYLIKLCSTTYVLIFSLKSLKYIMAKTTN